MTLFIFFLILSIAVSFLCSVWEAVFLSITPTFLKVKQGENADFAPALAKLKEDVDKPLISILTLNTIAHTVGAIGVGATTESAFAGILSEQHLHYAMLAVPVIMTLLILIASEIIPKTIGATYWQQLTPFTTKCLNFLVKLLTITGIMFLLRQTTRLVGHGEHKSIMTRADFEAMSSIGEEEGVIKENESKVIQNVLKLDGMLHTDFMTPRTRVTAAQQDQTLLDFYEKNKDLQFSRIPIYDNTVDDATHYILKDELLVNIINKKGNQPLSSIGRRAMIFSDDTPVTVIFNKLTDSKEHISFIKDEFGGFDGVITQEDILEELLGMEIMDESDSIANLAQSEKDRWEEQKKDLGVDDADEIS